MIVVDSSCLLELILDTPQAPPVAERIFSGDRSLHAPHLCDLEIAQALRRLVASRVVDKTRAGQALEDLSELPLTRHPHWPMLSRVWQLRANFTAYDASYVVLAESLNAPMLTRDRRLANAAKTIVQVEVL